MKKRYFAPATSYSGHDIQPFLQAISRPKVVGGSDNGGSQSTTTPPVELGEPSDNVGFSKHRGFYSGFSD